MTLPSRQPRPGLRACLAGSAAVALVFTSCRSGPKNFDNENDALRREILELKTQVQTLQGERDEAQATLAQAQRLSWDGNDLAAEVRQAIPHCVRMDIGLFSGPADADDQPGFDVVDVYLLPRDGRGRFVQIVGTVSITVDLLPPAGAPPRRVAQLTLAAHELREAYRSGFTGTHYTSRLALDQPIPPGSGALAISASFNDALTGKIIDAHRILDVPTRRP